jgi:DNA ligase 1
MKLFADLYTELDETNSTNEKIEAMARYFAAAPPEDAAWAVYFLSGQRPRRAVSSRVLGEWAAAEVGIPDWLYRESYDAVGDSAETITLLLPDSGTASEEPLHRIVTEKILPLRNMDENEQRDLILKMWRELNVKQRFVYNKLLTGGFRVGVSQRLVTRALAQVAALDPAVIAHRLMGNWEPTADFYRALFSGDTTDADLSRPYPFFLAHPLEDAPADELGEDATEWLAEWKWDGIRGQIIKRQGHIYIWSRGEELVTERYPELAEMADHLPDGTVLDGELLPWRDGGVLPFAQLQRRIGRKKVGKKLLAEVPVVFLAYDMIEHNGDDIRETPLHERRTLLEAVVHTTNHNNLILSPVIDFNSWDDLTTLREESRDRHVEGMMLKRKSSAYQVGRKRSDWWKWKVEPYTIDAVLLYAQRGSGKRASLYTDYTFAVWDAEGSLIPFAKAYSGLTDKEIRQVDRYVRNSTKERFGPVRSVEPQLVMEIGFEAIQPSNRHKSGVAVRFPRILRWRHDKKIEDADTLARLQALLPNQQPESIDPTEQ